MISGLLERFPTQGNREFFQRNRELFSRNREVGLPAVSVDFSHTCLVRLRPRSVLTGNFAGEEDEMANETVCRVRYGEAFWRAHHEAWGRSELNQREYCEA